MSPDEKETVIRIGFDTPPTASIWSTQRAIWSRCEKAHWTLILESKDKAGRVVGREYEAPASALVLLIKNPNRQGKRGRPEAALAALAARRAGKA